jgi:general secretion pathway protein A
VSVIFERNAVKRLHALSGGVPRVINLLCDRALMAGADRGVHEITSEMIDQASDAISFRRPVAEVDQPRPSRRVPLVVGAVIAVVVLGVLVALLVPWHRMVETTVPSLPAAPPAQVPAVDAPTIPADTEAAIEALANGPGTSPLNP